MLKKTASSANTVLNKILNQCILIGQMREQMMAVQIIISAKCGGIYCPDQD